jgi:hypothetical protein
MGSRYNILIGKPEGSDHWGEWENDVKCDDVAWISLAQGRVQWWDNTVMSFWVL